MATNKGLGRGLESLFGQFEEEYSYKNITNNMADVHDDKESGVTEIAIEKIRPNPNQPRKRFDETSLRELADSIKLHGVIQPIVLNKTENGYLIIAGERRYRASKIAGLSTIPAIIRNYTDKQVKEISIIENLQREDLNPIEAAKAIKELMEEYSLTQESVAERIGKSRSNIANTLRLLSLYPDVIKLVEDGKLSSGHARALVTITDQNLQLKLAKMASENKLSVRDLEKAVKKFENNTANNTVQKIEQSIELKELINRMQRIFATKVSAIGNDKKGRIYIDYYNRDDLDRISELMDLIQKKELTLQDLQNFNNRNKK